jgi:hypothetical protein
MSEAIKLPYYTIEAKELADWLDEQGSWWIVDGDPVLMSHVDFACPSDELSAELRRIDKPLRMFDPREGSTAHGETVPLEQLNDMADTNNNSHARTYLLSWAGDSIQWLLMEDHDAEKAFA